MEILFGITTVLGISYACVTLTKINIKMRVVTRKIKDLDINE